MAASVSFNEVFGKDGSIKYASGIEPSFHIRGPEPENFDFYKKTVGKLPDIRILPDPFDEETEVIIDPEPDDLHFKKREYYQSLPKSIFLREGELYGVICRYYQENFIMSFNASDIEHSYYSSNYYLNLYRHFLGDVLFGLEHRVKSITFNIICSPNRDKYEFQRTLVMFESSYKQIKSFLLNLIKEGRFMKLKKLDFVRYENEKDLVPFDQDIKDILEEVEIQKALLFFRGVNAVVASGGSFTITEKK